MGKKKRVVRDKHLLYGAAVQSVEADIDFFEKVYKKKRGSKFQRLREDFCGTATLACEWVRRGSDHLAWGVDLHQPTLDWGVRHNVPVLEDDASRLTLICDDVLRVDTPEVDVVAALNFSFSVFHTRDLLCSYFKQVRRSMAPGGIFFIDTLGGGEAMDSMVEKRKIPTSKGFDGTKVPAFTYVWEQVSFNPIDHHFVCRIHFKLADGTQIKRAFHYDWRLWTLPELQELMLEAGFAKAEVYVEGWDEEADDTDGIFRRRKKFDPQEAWVAYVVGLT